MDQETLALLLVVLVALLSATMLIVPSLLRLYRKRRLKRFGRALLLECRGLLYAVDPALFDRVKEFETRVERLEGGTPPLSGDLRLVLKIGAESVSDRQDLSAILLEGVKQFLAQSEEGSIEVLIDLASSPEVQGEK